MTNDNDTKANEADLAQINMAVEQALLTARRWTDRSLKYSESSAAKLLAKVLEHPDGLAFTVAFVDGVVRPEDYEVAARNLEQLVQKPPTFLPPWLGVPASLGGRFASYSPKLVVSAARRVFTELVGDLVLDVSDKKLGTAIAKLRESGARLNINLLGEAVLGNEEADRRLQSTFELLKRPDVDYVSMKVSSVVGPHSDWSHSHVVSTAVERLLPLYLYAASNPVPKFINLDMEEYHDLDLTLDVFKELLDNPALKNLEMGIVIQAYLPDALGAMKVLHGWAKERVRAGGAPIKVRLVKGANLAMERVQAEVHGWPLAVWDSKQATDANYLRILDWALRPECTRYMRLGVAGHNLFSLATAWELAGIRGVREDMDIEMLAGMATPQANAITEDAGPLLYYVPVVRPTEFDVAIAYLVRRLEENADSANFMSSVFDIAVDQNAFDKERDRYVNAVEQMIREGETRCHPNRSQNRLTETIEDFEAEQKDSAGKWQFANIPDSDPSLPGNRQWAEQIISRIDGSKLGEETVQANLVQSEAEAKAIVERAEKAGRKWAKTSAATRADLLHRCGFELSKRRDDLLEVAAAEAGKSLDQTDPEVSEAIDFAHYYAEQISSLEDLPGAKFVSGEVTLVTPPWNFPISIPAGGVLAAIAAGSAVIFKPSSAVRRSGAIIAECLWAAGVEKDLVQLALPTDGSIGKAFVTDKRVDNVILTGSSDTAKMFLSWRPDLNLLAETSGKNSIIVTPSADLDLAVRDVVYSAFGHAGQKCSAASLVILVGSVAKSQRFHRQLIDATKSLIVDWPSNPASEMGPLTVPPGEKLLAGLSTLGPGERWNLKPRQLDDSGRLWSPGIRSGVVENSAFHKVEYFGPILGVMRADTLEDAIRIQNGTAFGLTAGLHSLDPEEIEYWLDRIKAGNVYVNRSTTGAIVRRQSFGGWKLSAVGAGAKAGGPNYLYGFGKVLPSGAAEAKKGMPTKPQLRELVAVANHLLLADDAELVLTAALNAEAACQEEFDLLRDASALHCERNVFRYVPTASVIRCAPEVPLAQTMMAAAYAVAVGTFRTQSGEYSQLTRFAPGQAGEGDWGDNRVVISSGNDLPDLFVDWAKRFGFGYVREENETFIHSLAGSLSGHDQRVRLLGCSRGDLGDDLASSIDIAVWDSPITAAARAEILPFVHEQAVSITTHRFGTPSVATTEIMKPTAS